MCSSDLVQKRILQAGEFFANPSAQYHSALEASNLLEDARKECALFMQANSEEIVFTSGATDVVHIITEGPAPAAGSNFGGVTGVTAAVVAYFPAK